MGKTNVEYATDQITVYPAPCPFKCRYCWSQDPLWIHRTKNPNPIWEAEQLSRVRKPKTVVVSFTTDPYQPRELAELKTLETLTVLAASDHKVMVLTKSCVVETDFPQFAKWVQNRMDLWLGMTLTSVVAIDDEPLASPNPLRIKTLQNAHNIGLKTWVSIEPWIPDKTFPRQIIEATHGFVDWYVIGRLDYETRHGYTKIPKGYYREELKWVRALFDEFGFSPSSKPCERGYHIKRQLQENP